MVHSRYLPSSHPVPVRYRTPRGRPIAAGRQPLSIPDSPGSSLTPPDSPGSSTDIFPGIPILHPVDAPATRRPCHRQYAVRSSMLSPLARVSRVLPGLPTDVSREVPLTFTHRLYGIPRGFPTDSPGSPIRSPLDPPAPAPEAASGAFSSGPHCRRTSTPRTGTTWHAPYGHRIRCPQGPSRREIIFSN